MHYHYLYKCITINQYTTLNISILIGILLRNVHNVRNKDLRDQFTVLKKCLRNLDCLIYEMLFIKNKKKTPYTPPDAIKAKPFYLTVPPRLEFYFILFSLNNHMH